MNSERKLKPGFLNSSRRFCEDRPCCLKLDELSIELAGLKGALIVPTRDTIHYDSGGIEDPSIDIGLLITILRSRRPIFIFTDLETWQNVMLVTSSRQRPHLVLTRAITQYGFLSKADLDLIITKAEEITI